MKVIYKTGKFTIEAEGSTTDIFEQLAAFDSVFGNAEKCKATGGTNIGFKHREVDGNHYYEMYDKDSGHTLKFGKTKKDGSLFPRRKDTDGNWMPDGGWAKYDPNTPTVKSTSEKQKLDVKIPF